MHNRVADGSLDGLSEFSARHQKGVDIYVVRVEREPGVIFCETFVVDRYQDKIDIRLLPYFVVGKATAQNGGENRLVALYLLNQLVQSSSKLFLNRSVPHPLFEGL